MTDKTQPTAHAEITAPISADLRRIDSGAQPETLAAAARRLANVADQVRALEPEGGESDVYLTEASKVLRECAGHIAGLEAQVVAKGLQQSAQPDALAEVSKEQYARMFNAACEALGQISDHLGIDSDIDPGAEPIIEAIDELRAAALQAAPPAPAAVAVQPEDMRDKVTLALGLSLAPKGGPSFAWSYLLDSIRELVKCEEELVLLKAGQEMSKNRPAFAAAPAQPAAWMTPEGDRMVTEATMASARKDGGAMLSSLRPFIVALARAAAPAQAKVSQDHFAPAQEHATQLAGQDWDRIKGGLSILMLGFAKRTSPTTLKAAEAVLDAATEPGAPLAMLRAAAPAQAQEDARDAGRWRHFSARGVFPKNVWNNGNGHWQYGEIRALTAEGVADAAIAARAAQGGA